MEELAAQHIRAFSSFLGSKKVQSKTNAKQKLSKLTKNQFAELSTDVYDELMRRNSNQDSFLIPKESFHPKRNQARGKLATLPLNRFEELVSDVYTELTARFPYIEDEKEALKVAIPTSKSKGSARTNTSPPKSVPPKGPIPSQSSREKEAVNFKSLDNLMADLDGMMTPSAFESAASPEFRDLPSTQTADYSAPVSAISSGPQDLGSSAYQAQIDALREQLLEKQDEIDSLLSIVQKPPSLKSAKEALESKVSSLEQQLSTQVQQSAKVQQESATLLQELKTLSVENASLRGAKEKSASQINDLFIQIQDWKSRAEDEAKKRKALEIELANTKRERDDIKKKAASKVRPSSIMERLQYSRTNPNIDFEMDGIVGNQVLDKSLLEDYYVAVGEILSEARAQEEPNTNILVAMKNVVYVCKSITQDLDEFESKFLQEDPISSPTGSKISNLSLLKQDMSQALTYQMGLAKQFAVEPDEAVKEAIEEAMTALTGVIVDIYQATESLLFQKEQENEQQQQQQQSSLFGQEQSLASLKSFLEQETDEIVKSIQSLLTILKTPTLSSADLDASISSISSIVTSLIITCENPVRQAKGNVCDDIFYELEEGQQGLEELGELLKSDAGNKGIKQQIASRAYGIAKVVKRLIEVI